MRAPRVTSRLKTPRDPMPTAVLAEHTSRLARLEDMCARLADENARLRAAPASQSVAVSTRRDASAAPTRLPANHATANTGHLPSRRQLLGLGAKAAVATVAAGVLVEQVGTRSADASGGPGSFSSNIVGTPAVLAQGTSGADGVDAGSDTGFGVYAISTSGVGVSANSSSGVGIAANSTSGPAVSAYSNSSHAVLASSGSGVGVSGSSNNGDGVYGLTAGSSVYGMHGINLSNAIGSIAVLGHSDNGASGLGPGIGVQGETGTGSGVYGTAVSGDGVDGSSITGIGVGGASASGVGVSARSVTGDGLQAFGGGGTAAAVRAAGGSGDGVVATGSGGAAHQTLYGLGTSGTTGLRASSDSGNGIVASSTSGTGINVQSGSGSAVIATSGGVGYGLYLTATSGWAIGCVGRIRVLGNAFGTATLAGGTTSKTVSTGACDSGSLVLLTPMSDPGARVWAVAGAGAFTIHASGAPASNIIFTYLLIN